MPGTHRDLCWTCNFAASCVNRGTAERPKLYCEQFDSYVPRSPVSEKVASRAASGDKKDSDEYKYKGLCLNCENRETCTLSGSQGGVWHCEEYR
jgi:hypothetical protein